MARSRTTFFALLAAGSISAWACDSAGDPTPRVVQALQQEQIDGVEVDWEAERRFLILKGSVDTQQDRAQAGHVADQAAGRGALVINELTLADGEVSELDATVEERLQSLLAGDPMLSERSLSIDVNDQVVTITGDVRSPEERSKVEQLAWRVAGVRDVSNDVQVIG